MLRRRPAPTISRKGAALFGLVIALAAGLLVVPILPGADRLGAGDVAPRDLHARHSVQFVSDALTEKLRAEASAAVDPVIDKDPAVETRQAALLTDLFEQVRRARSRTDLSVQERVSQLRLQPPASAMPLAALEAAVSLDVSTLDAAAELAAQGIQNVLFEPATAEDLPFRIDAFMLLEVNGALAESGARLLVREALTSLAVPNFVVDEAATALRRENAAANVPPETVTWSEGQVIAFEGDVLDAAQIESLEHAGTIDNTFDEVADVAAGVVASAGLGIVLAVFLYQLQPASAGAVRRLALCAAVFVGALTAVRFVVPAFLPDIDEHYLIYALPLASAAMIAASLLEVHFAAIVAVSLGLFAAFMGATIPDLAGASYLGPLQALELAVTFTVSGLIGAVAVHRVERFTRYGVAAVSVATATWLVLITFWLLREDRTNESLAWLSAAAAVNGLGSAVITVGVFVILSMVLGITTRLQLMELGQTDHPLLSRLQEEAPGTFHHSMMVATLAERAATRIGADALIARVGAYYHDIGKIAQPRWYVENMIDGQPSPHDSLDPRVSARRIMEHVTNGLDLARRYGLPPAIREFIPQHHGTRLVAFFYRRASAAGGQPPDPADFRYQGPRPQTKETAIVMLADSCEAVVRASSDRSRLDDLVDGVFAERLAEGQLDECDITMRELQEVAASFRATLRAVYHPRIEYPAPSAEELAAIARPELPEPPVVSPHRG